MKNISAASFQKEINSLNLTSTSQQSPLNHAASPSPRHDSSARSLSWRQQRKLGSDDTGTGNTATDYEAREVNFRLHKYSMRMEMGLLRVPDESGCKGLVAVAEEVPRCQIQTHVSVCGCHGCLSAADKIEQIAGVGGTRWRCSFTSVHTLTAANTTCFGVLCQACAAIYLFRLHFQVCGRSWILNRRLAATCNPGMMYTGAKGSQLQSVAKSLGVILELRTVVNSLGAS